MLSLYELVRIIDILQEHIDMENYLLKKCSPPIDIEGCENDIFLISSIIDKLKKHYEKRVDSKQARLTYGD